MFFSEKPQIYSEAREQHNKHKFRICNAALAQAQKSILLTLVHVGKEGLGMEINDAVVDHSGSRSHSLTSGCLAVEAQKNYFPSSVP